MEDGTKLLNWSLAKQEEMKFRLWKEFGLLHFLDDSHQEIYPKSLVSDSEFTYFLDTFKVREHFNATLSHKKFVQKTFSRFQKCFESYGITKEQINKHDDSKLTSFIEIVGYTDRWILNIKTDEWNQAWKHHCANNPHHPEYFIIDKSGQNVRIDMDYLYLVESVIDMIACRWERPLYGSDLVSNQNLLNIDKNFLKRYTSNDRMKVRAIIDQLQKA